MARARRIDTTCSAFNTCRTCDMILTISGLKHECSEITTFPIATVAEYGTYHHHNSPNKTSDYDPTVVHQIKAEVLARGPVATAVNGKPLHTYHGGIYSNGTSSKGVTHVVSIVGWGQTRDADTGEVVLDYWIVRNSWGEYWGEMGYFRIGPIGHNILGIEHSVAWATPGTFTVQNFPCHANGKNCRNRSRFGPGPDSTTVAQLYEDPWHRHRQVGSSVFLAERL
eukprot:CAMPEP_0168724264 /NCGR_PEP_ID=MMETSP0724-20121128/3546_1 /TAXON_ID=265536 /ORGANISM="Amphiprora sp., Strain CCMP467" /LENGTH=224 /DNA_ID=CAMNT_0008771007 /DNA_START=158 /DNA_END=832 /DNA_ORIENTATION=+